MNLKKHRPEVIVFVHDAGGAEVVGAYIRRNRAQFSFHCYGAGPALRVFRRLGVPLRKVSDDRKELSAVIRRHPKAAYALCGAPGWMTKTEFNALQEAKHAGLKTVVYMDSWIDDRLRFGYPARGWQRHLPDVFWAGDHYARAGLRRRFPRVPVRYVPNQYFANEVVRYRAHKRASRAADTVLFMSTIGGPSHELLEAILAVLARERRRTCVRIRFHPADDRSRYDALTVQFKDLVRIELSREKDIVKDLLRARIVVGSETVAMAVSVLCGIRTISFCAPGTRAVLPFNAIRRTRSSKNAAQLALTLGRGRQQ